MQFAFFFLSIFALLLPLLSLVLFAALFSVNFAIVAIFCIFSGVCAVVDLVICINFVVVVAVDN